MSQSLNLPKRLSASIAMLLLFLGTAFAQGGLTVRGTVSDASGAALPGATVQVKGTLVGVSTDGTGSYAINTRKGATLV